MEQQAQIRITLAVLFLIPVALASWITVSNNPGISLWNSSDQLGAMVCAVNSSATTVWDINKAPLGLTEPTTINDQPSACFLNTPNAPYLDFSSDLITLFVDDTPKNPDAPLEGDAPLGGGTDGGLSTTCGNLICDIKESTEGSCEIDCGKGEYTCEEYPEKIISCDIIKGGICFPDEVTCKADWVQYGKLYCGDSICSIDENPESCLKDCGTGEYTCLDDKEPKPVKCEFIKGGLCQPEGISCKAGWLLGGQCGDGFCAKGEDTRNCPSDCPALPFCGDGTCGSGEDFKNCPGDCLYCGDGMCSGGETTETCLKDCPKIVQSSVLTIVREPVARWIKVYDNQEASIEEKGDEICIRSKAPLGSLNVYDYKGVTAALVEEKDGTYCYTPKTEQYLKFGNHSTILVLQNETFVRYNQSNLTVDASLLKWNGEDFVTAPDDVWVDANNSIGLKFGANDVVATSDTQYKYIWISNQPIGYDGGYYIMADSTEYTYCSITDKQYISTTDICSWENSSCEFSLSEDNLTLSVTFTAPYNATLGMVRIDPAYTLSYTSASSGTFYNRTEGTNLGVRLSAPVLFMNFNHANESTYVQDNSLYNNYGTLGASTAAPTYNATGGYDGSGAYVFDGVAEYISVTSTTDLAYSGSSSKSVSLWFYSGNLTGVHTIIGKWANPTDSNNREYIIYTSGSNLTVAAADIVQSAVVGISPSTWYNVVLTMTSSKVVTLYLNGNLVSSYTSTGSVSSPTAELRIGQNTNSNYFKGIIDQVQIIPRALSASEVAALYNGSGTAYNGSNEIGKYARNGNYTSLVFYNSTASYWNNTLSIVDTKNRSGIVNADNTINTSFANLVSYWSFDGGSLNDNLGYNNQVCQVSASCVNNATGLVSGGAIHPTATTEYIASTLAAGHNLTGYPYTSSLWFKTTSTTAYLMDIAAPGSTADNHCMYISTSILMIYTRDTGTVYSCGTRTVADGNWHMGTVVWASNTQKDLYVDGVYDCTVTSSVQSRNVNRVGFGALVDDTPSGIAGVGFYDEGLLYNAALTATQINQLYKSGLSQHANTNITLWTRTANTYNTSDSGLVSFWSMQNNSGTTVYDQTGRNNGTTKNAPSYSENYGIIGGAYNFTGSATAGNTSINVGNSSSFLFTNGTADRPFSITFWYYPYTLQSSSNYQYFFSKSIASPAAYSYWGGIAYSGQVDFGMYSQNNPAAYHFVRASTAIPSANQWYYITYVYNASSNVNPYSMLIYINGVQQTTSDASTGVYTAMGLNTVNLTIGNENQGTGRGILGTLDEVRIYNRSLSAAEVLSLYNLGSAHISDWSNWTNNGLVTDNTSITSSGSGKFFQWRTELVTNDTNVSPYLLNHTIVMSGAGISAPTLLWNWTQINSTIYTNYTQVCVNTSVSADNCTLTLNGTFTNATSGTGFCFNATPLSYGNQTANASCTNAGGTGTINSAWVNVSYVIFTINNTHSENSFAPSAFVKVNGTSFTLAGNNYTFTGANSYYLADYATNFTYDDAGNAITGSRIYVDEILDKAQSLNINVMRTWAMMAGGQGTAPLTTWALNTTGGHYNLFLVNNTTGYNENMFAGLDYVIYQASKRDIRVQLVLVNNWNTYGGMTWWVQQTPSANWSLPGNNSETGLFHDQFYTNTETRQLFQTYVAYVLNRTNTYSGIKYKDDPAIFSWLLVNEPRAKGDGSTANSLANRQKIANWTTNMTAFIKGIDTNHVIGLGLEGLDYNQGWGEGTDWFLDQNNTGVDFATFEINPYQWDYLSQATENATNKPSGLQTGGPWANSTINWWTLTNNNTWGANWATSNGWNPSMPRHKYDNWVLQHVKWATQNLSMPVVIEEVEVQTNINKSQQDKFLQQETQTFFNNNGDGMMFWNFNHDNYWYSTTGGNCTSYYTGITGAGCMDDGFSFYYSTDPFLANKSQALIDEFSYAQHNNTGNTSFITLLNNNQITFYYNVTLNAGIDNCSLWINTTNSSSISTDWYKDQTNYTIVNGSNSFVKLFNRSAVYSYWRVECCYVGSCYNSSQGYVSTPPLVSLYAPADYTVFNNTGIQFNYTVEDGLLINSCSLLLNGNLNQTNSTMGTGAIIASAFNVSVPATYGEYMWQVRCTDMSSNTRYSERWHFTYGISQINTSNLSPLNNTITNQSSQSYNVTINSTVPISTIAWILNSIIQSIYTITGDVYTIDYNHTASLSDGTYNWFYQIMDRLGFIVNTSAYNITIDATPPTLSWNWTDINTTLVVDHTYVCVNASETLNNCTFNFNGTDYFVAGGSTNVCHNFTDLADGNNTVSATCHDIANTAALTGAWVNFVSAVNWNWAQANTTIYVNSTTVSATTTKSANCTLDFNGTTYSYGSFTTTPSWPLTSLPNGNYSSINITCNNSFGHVFTSSNVWLYVEVKTTPTLSWSWSEMNMTILNDHTQICVLSNQAVNCTLGMDGNYYANPVTSFLPCWDRTSLADGNHTNINITCENVWALTSNLSGSWVYTNYYDPVITIQSPLSITYGTGTILFNITVASTPSETSCTYNVDGVGANPLTHTGSYWHAIDVGMSEATHTVVFNCTDGVRSGTATRSFAVDLNPPIISLEHPLTGEYLGTPFISFEFTPTVDINPLDKCLLYTNTTGVWQVDYIWTIPMNATTNMALLTLGDGTYTWNVWCNDTTGINDWSAQGNQTFVVDTIAPTISWNWTDINKTIAVPSTTVCVNTSEGALCTLHWNGTDYAKVTYSQQSCWTQGSLSNGNYTSVYVSCEDPATNLGTSTTAWLNVSATPSAFPGTLVSHTFTVPATGLPNVPFTASWTANFSDLVASVVIDITKPYPCTWISGSNYTTATANGTINGSENFSCPMPLDYTFTLSIIYVNAIGVQNAGDTAKIDLSTGGGGAITGSVCGDHFCTGLENCTTCPGDCGVCQVNNQTQTTPTGAVPTLNISMEWGWILVVMGVLFFMYIRRRDEAEKKRRKGPVYYETKE